MEDTARDDTQSPAHFHRHSVDPQPSPVVAAAVVAVRFAVEGQWRHSRESFERDVFGDEAAVAHSPTTADMSAHSFGDSSFSLNFLSNLTLNGLFLVSFFRRHKGNATNELFSMCFFFVLFRICVFTGFSFQRFTDANSCRLCGGLEKGGKEKETVICCKNFFPFFFLLFFEATEQLFCPR